MIKLIPEVIINRISAGEVIECPASIIKELIENSLDAGASEIEISLRNAGKSFISIRDNGHGIPKDDLPLALTPHATSKLNESYDLFDIHTFGFRGEALASIANVSKIKISSKHQDASKTYQIISEYGVMSNIELSRNIIGTSIEISNLFYSVPVRLKFLKSDRTELIKVIKVIQDAALSAINTSFRVISENKLLFHYQPTNDLLKRFSQIIEKSPKDFFVIQEQSDAYGIKAVTSIPNLNKPGTQNIRCFINSRPIQNKIINHAVKDSYGDLIPSNSYPICVLFINMPRKEVDINVHPAKTEVKFSDELALQQTIKKFFMKNINMHSNKTSIGLPNSTTHIFMKNCSQQGLNYQYKKIIPTTSITDSNRSFAKNISYPVYNSHENLALHEDSAPYYIEPSKEAQTPEALQQAQPILLGMPILQLANRYILSNNGTNIFVIDQHAVHERITYEQLKKDFFNGGIKSQILLTPEIIQVKEIDTILFKTNLNYFQDLGLVFDAILDDHIIIKAIPAILEKYDIKILISEIINDLHNYSSSNSIEIMTKKILATFACHHSIRSGKTLTIPEMSELLRSIETMENTGQCNHGRPSYCKISLRDLDKLFER